MAEHNLLFVGPWPPPFGGIAGHLYELLPGMVNKGYDIITLSYTDDKVELNKTERGVRNINFSPKSFFRSNTISIGTSAITKQTHRKGLSIKKYLRALSIAKRVNELIEREDITYVFTYGNDQIYLLPFINKSNIKGLFCTIYAAFYTHPEKYIRDKRFLSYALGFADKVLSCSNYCVISGQKFLNIDYPVKVLYNNVDKDVYNPINDGKFIRQRHDISESAIVLMTMGRIMVDMGIDFLLRNIENITQIDPKLIIFFVGAKEDLCKEVEELSKTNSQVRHAFNIPLKDKHFYFAACDIFTAPTKEKQACMGIANIEAMMSGRAVISSTSGGHPETIEDKVTGILVPFINGILNADIYLEKLAQLVKDKELREGYGKRGRERSLRLFTNEQIVQEHIDLINEFP